MKTNKRSDEYKSVFGVSRGNLEGPKSTADWGTVNQNAICQLIREACSRGGAVRFGYTRDGGAYALGLYYGGDHVTKYLPPGEDVIAFLEEWIEFYGKLPDSKGKSPDQP